MSTPQNTIAIVYDYNQTLSPSYMQDEVVFPAFGIDGAKLNFYKGLPDMFEQFRDGLLSAEHHAHGVSVEHYIISSGLKVLLDGSRLQPYVRAIFGCEFDEDDD